MKSKLLNTLLLLTFLVGYLEWGTDQKTFIFEAEFEIIRKAFIDPVSLIHPFILIPFCGQVLLLITLFQKEADRKLTLFGVLFLSTLIVMLTVIGLYSFNLKILGSTIPFIVVAILIVRNKIPFTHGN